MKISWLQRFAQFYTLVSAVGAFASINIHVGSVIVPRIRNGKGLPYFRTEHSNGVVGRYRCC